MDQTANEEIWNTWSHAFGALLGIFGLGVLLNGNAHNTAYSMLSIWIYGVSVVLLFSVSALYHYIKDARLKTTFRKLDHISIYFLIAGTYTPVCLVALISGNGWWLFATVWGITFIGTFLKLFYTGKFEFLSLLLYVIMGWLIAFDGKNVWEALSTKELYLMLLGGFFYTFGILFYIMKKMPYHHVVWHFFVLAGAISHYVMIVNIVS